MKSWLQKRAWTNSSRAAKPGFPPSKLAERAFQRVIVTGALHLLIGGHCLDRPSRFPRPRRQKCAAESFSRRRDQSGPSAVHARRGMVQQLMGDRKAATSGTHRTWR
jgi:hypothetical protein